MGMLLEGELTFTIAATANAAAGEMWRIPRHHSHQRRGGR